MFSLFLQNPPAVLPKLVSLIKESWREEKNMDKHLVIIKNLDFALLVIKKSPWRENEIKKIKEKVKEEHFDFTYYPDIKKEEAEIVFQTRKRYYQIVEDILSGKETRSTFDLRPSRDNRPYFSNFFRLEQLREAWINLGKRWLPFGGSGFWLVVLILVLVITLAFFLIFFPAKTKRKYSLCSKNFESGRNVDWSKFYDDRNFSIYKTGDDSRFAFLHFFSSPSGSPGFFWVGKLAHKAGIEFPRS